MNIWNNIIGWFRDWSERRHLINSFNASARDAFVNGEAPAMLSASISRGDRSYQHDFTRLLASGFRIKVYTGRQLSRDEMIYIGMTILSNQQLVRRLVVLGWDTLEIHGSQGAYGCKWKLSDYIERINLIGHSVIYEDS